ncbi:MAG: ATP-binding protein [Defluviitaleaceae bacterium]|nr:ATP-binding protein [Defluviitaleaceae bacterium]
MSFGKAYSAVNAGRPVFAPEELLERLPVACGCFDTDGLLVAANARWLAMFGFENVEDFNVCLPPTQSCGKPTRDYLRRHISLAQSRDGHTFFLQTPILERVEISLQSEAHGLVVACAYDVSIHIAELETVLDEVHEAAETTEVFLNTSPLAIIMRDRNFKPVDCNPAALELFEVRDKQKFLRGFGGYAPKLQPCGTPSPELAAAHAQAAIKHDNYHFEFTHTTAYGKSVPTDTIVTRCTYNGGQMFATYVLDMRLAMKSLEIENDADKRAMIMMDATPLSCFMVRPVVPEHGMPAVEAIDCNNAALALFGFESKQEAVDGFFNLFPGLYAGDTADCYNILLSSTAALEMGFHRFEYTHRSMRGEIIPCEITLVRVDYKGSSVLACYQNDLRAIKASMERERETNEVYEILINSAPFIINVWDEAHNLVSTSDASISIFGLDSRAEYMERFHKLMPEFQPCGGRSDELIVTRLNEALEHGYANFEWMHTTIYNEPLPAEVTLVRFRRHNANFLVSYMNDQRGIKAALAKVHESYEMAQRFIDAAPFFVEIWDDNIRLVECNRTTAEMFGLSSTEEYMRIFKDLSPEYQPCGTLSSEKIVEVIGTAFREGRNEIEWMHIDRHGNPFPTKVIYVRLWRGDKDIVVGYNMDLRPIMAAMDKVQASLEMAQMFIDAAPFFVEIWDESLNLVECNRTAADLFGLNDTAEYMRIFDELSPEYQPCGTPSSEKIVTLIAEAFRKGRLRTEWTHLLPDGQILPCDVTYVRLRRGDSNIIVGYNMDMRETRRREIAEHANKAKSNFLSTMSHEIRTPMNAILGVTDIQLMNPYLDDEVRDAFDKIYASGDLLLSIINDILDLSKIEAGKMDLIINKYEVASFVSDIVQLNMMRIGSKHIDFNLVVDADLPAYIMGDELRVKQILNNLLSNAFKYTDQGSVTLHISHCDSNTNDSEVILVFSIIDTGKGMTQEQLDKLFDEYARFTEGTARAIEGTGLGMSICRNLINMMNGEIFVESEIDVGSSFTVHLPQGKTDGGVMGEETAENLRRFRADNRSQMKRVQMTREAMPYGSVLIVDDVETNIYVAKGLLVPYELKIDWAYSGAAAIEKVQEGNVYDIIFMDHMMPVMDGIEATKILRRMGYHHPIVALTANAVVGQADVFLLNGFDDFISKPIDVRHLNSVLNKLVRGRHPQELYETRRREPVLRVAADPSRAVPIFSDAFVRDAKKSISALDDIMHCEEQLTPEELRTYIVYVHGMRSALLNVKNPDLSEVAARLEDLGRQKDFTAIFSETPPFLTALRAFTQHLEWENRSRQQFNSVSEDDIPFLHEKLQSIKFGAENYDESIIDKALEKLDSKTWTPETSALINTISKCLLHSDFEDIAEAIDKFLAKGEAEN